MSTGTDISRIIPWIIANGIRLLRLRSDNIDGRHTSIEFIPARDMADTPRPLLEMKEQNTNAASSLIMLASKAVVANIPAASAPDRLWHRPSRHCQGASALDKKHSLI